MIKKTVNYVDFDGNERTEECIFNLTRAEAMEFALTLPDEVKESIEDGQSVDITQASSDILNKLGPTGIIDFIKKLLLKSYGIKSSDGRRIEKSEQISTEFSQTVAFDEIFMELVSDDIAAANFVNGVIPAQLAEKVKSEQPAIVK